MKCFFESVLYVILYHKLKNTLIVFNHILVTRGYGKPSDRDSGSDDEEMSDEGQDDTLNNTTREKNNDTQHQRLEFVMGEHVLPRDMTVYQVMLH